MITRTTFFLRRLFTKRRDVVIYNSYDLLKRPDLYTQGQVGLPYRHANGSTDTHWHPARQLGPSWDQWKAVWLVLTGRADVLHWPGQET